MHTQTCPRKNDDDISLPRQLTGFENDDDEPLEDLVYVFLRSTRDRNNRNIRKTAYHLQGFLS